MSILSKMRGMFRKKPESQEVTNKITLPNGRVAVVDSKGNIKGWDVLLMKRK